MYLYNFALQVNFFLSNEENTILHVNNIGYFIQFFCLRIENQSKIISICAKKVKTIGYYDSAAK